MALYGSPAAAQKYQPFGPVDIRTDMQIFAPADLGDFGKRPKPNEGYFFAYEKLNWSTMSVKTPTGIEAPVILSPDYLPGGPIAPAPVPNTFDVNLPDSRFGWGDRYEMGYMQDREGWLLGVLDGLDSAQDLFLGDLPGAPTTGSVVIVFADPFNIMQGFVDRRTDSAGGGSSTDGPDGIADDIDEDGVNGPDTDNQPTDFDDLVDLLPTFDSVQIRTLTKINGVELMRMRRFRPFHNGSFFEIHYGARLLRFKDLFETTANGSATTTLGDSIWDARVNNNIVGPQLTGRWIDTRGRWTFDVEGRFLAAVNIQNADLTGTLGENAVAAGLNSPLNFSTTSFRHNTRQIDFSPVAELRVETSYQITKSFAATVGYTAVYAGNITRASKSIEYRLPDMGLVQDGRDDLFTNGVNFGVEFNR